MGMTKIRKIFIAALVLALSACSSAPRRPAPVVDRATAGAQANGAAAAAQPAGNGYYTVKKGDTLYRIALEFGQSSRDIVAWNNLANANDIKVNQVLRVLPPNAAATSSGVQVGSVAATSGVEVRPLNALPPPAVSAPHGPEARNKSGPLGDKKPYSEATLAEMQKPAAAAAPSTTAKAEAPKPADNSTKAAGEDNGDEGVAWIWPTEGKVVANFDAGKKGIDIAGKLGQPILAAGAGKVMYAGSGIRGYGNLVIIKHTNNLLSAYAHNKTILVKEGQIISKGQKIAEMGNSDADGVKLHFEIRRQGKPVDPSKFLPRR